MTDWLATDNTTIALGLVLAAVFLTRTFLQPQSLVHPILLGRQSDVDRVRKTGESAIYRNYGTGLMGRLPARPVREVQVLADLVKPDFQTPRSLWSTKITNSDLMARAVALGAGFVHVAGLVPKETNVLLLLNDGLEFLITDLALASCSIPSFTLSSLTLLTPLLEAHPPNAIVLHSRFVGQVLELILENNEFSHHTLIVLGDDGLPNNLDQLRGQVRILRWEDLEGSKAVPVQGVAPHSDDVFTVSFYPGSNGELKATQLTHENMTAGVTAVRFLLPLSNAIAPSDSILSAHSLSTPYGRAIAYTALYEGTAFATVNSTALYGLDRVATKSLSELLNVRDGGLPSPTILFITPQHLDILFSSIISNAKHSSTLFFLAWRHKLASLQQGYISKDTLWDRMAFTKARQTVLKDMSETLRGVIVSDGPLEADVLTPSRLALSVPLVNVHTNPLIAGPLFASHPLDLQSFPSDDGDKELAPFAHGAHVGPPAINIEVKLAGLDDAAVEAGAKPTGELLVRGPPVGRTFDDSDVVADSWIRVRERAMVQNNGTFKVLPTVVRV